MPVPLISPVKLILRGVVNFFTSVTFSSISRVPSKSLAVAVTTPPIDILRAVSSRALVLEKSAVSAKLVVTFGTFISTSELPSKSTSPSALPVNFIFRAVLNLSAAVISTVTSFAPVYSQTVSPLLVIVKVLPSPAAPLGSC